MFFKNKFRSMFSKTAELDNRVTRLEIELKQIKELTKYITAPSQQPVAPVQRERPLFK